MTTSSAAPTPVQSTSVRKRTARALALMSLSLVALTGCALFVTGAGVPQNDKARVMQESLVSHGVITDDETAKRASWQCSYDGRTIIVDLIADFEGSKQLVSVQCTSQGTISAAVATYPTR